MDPEAFRKHGKEMIDFVADYWLNIRERRPLPDIQHGYMREMAPQEPEPWSAIFADLEPVIMRGSTAWHSPNWYAYYPTACSYPSIIGDILSGGLANIGFTWRSSPAMTELEQVMTDWMAKALGLPHTFLNSDAGPGGGIIQCTASDATLVALLSARARAVNFLKKQAENRSPFTAVVSEKFNQGKEALKQGIKSFGLFNQQPHSTPDLKGSSIFESHDPAYFSKLVAYCSDQAHSSVDKGIMLCGVRIRKLRSARGTQGNCLSGNYTVEPDVLESAIQEDRAQGLHPFVLIATIGSTNTCGVDSVEELGPICRRESIWLHVDAAYAGSFLLCEEYRYLLGSNGGDYLDSFNFNAHKALQINFDCSLMWFKNAVEAVKYFDVDATYLTHGHDMPASDYRHLQIALGRRFRSLKIWFVMRSLGIYHLQEWLRRGSDDLNERLCTDINEDGRIHLVPSTSHGTFFLRFAICSTQTTEEDVKLAVRVVVEMAHRCNTNNSSDKEI